MEQASASQHPGLVIRRVALSELHEDPANARAHGERNLEAIQASLQRFGQAEPLVVHQGTGRVIGGNGRLVAMRALGWTECDIVEVDLEAVEAAALGIALNRTAELADWDLPALGRLLDELRAEDALAGVGYSGEEIDILLAELQTELDDPVEDPGPGAPPVRPVSRPGDLWTLGPHRLLVGDATVPEALTTLMQGRAADLVWTDPPYGVSYTGGTEEALKIQNDELRGPELEQLVAKALGAAFAVTKPGGVWYVTAPAGPQFLEFAKVLTDLGVWRQTLVWVKDALVLGHSDFHYRHEAMFYGWKPGASHREPPHRKGDSVWEFARPRSSADHPTMKPVDLVQHALEMSTAPGELVLDPFMGSGTTLLAAERSARVAAGIELDPRYADVALRRWETATGSEAVLSGTGQTLAEVEKERSVS